MFKVTCKMKQLPKEDIIQQSFDEINKRIDELSKQLKHIQLEQKRLNRSKPITNIRNRIIGT